MKRTGFFIFLLLMVSTTWAQVNTYSNSRDLKKKKRTIDRPVICPDLYVSTSTGYNNLTSIAGFSIDFSIRKYLSAEAGLGYTWFGYKLSAGGKYYYKQRCQRGLAFGAGITHNSGNPAFKTKLETVTGNKEQVTFNIYAQTNAYLMAYYYWSIGKRNNRIYCGAGWSQPFNAKTYEQSSGDAVTESSKTTLNLLMPGGPIVMGGFSIGINN